MFIEQELLRDESDLVGGFCYRMFVSSHKVVDVERNDAKMLFLLFNLCQGRCCGANFFFFFLHWLVLEGRTCLFLS